jgi:hypothetical protein
LHLWCSTSYLALGCNPFRVLNQQTCLINLWPAIMFWSYSWLTSSWVLKANLCLLYNLPTFASTFCSPRRLEIKVDR